MPDDRPRVLVVDDDIDACANLQDILIDSDYEVTVAYTGEAAIDLVRGDTFDLALLDLKMPGIDGLAAFREIRHVSPRIAVLILSAYASASVADQALSDGARAVLHKPVIIEQLLPLLHQVVEARTTSSEGSPSE